MSRTTPALLLLLLLASGAAAADPAIPANTGNAAHDRLAGSSPRERNQALDRVLRSVGHGDCDVATTTFVEYHQGIASVWLATCGDGRRYVMKLIDRDDGAMAVFACDESAELKAYCAKSP